MGGFPKKKLANNLFFVLLAILPLISAWSGIEEGVLAGSKLARISFYDNYHISRRLLRKTFGFNKGDMVNELKINEGLKRIENKYKSEGFYFVILSLEENRNDENELLLDLKIEEGVRVKIGEINFSGNVLLSSKTLKKLITSRERGIFIRGYYDEERLSEDCSLIEEYYQESHLAKAKVQEVIKSFSSDGRVVDLTFVINEDQNEKVYDSSNEEAESGIDQTAADASEQEEILNESETTVPDSNDSSVKDSENKKSLSNIDPPITEASEKIDQKQSTITEAQNETKSSAKNTLDRKALLEELAFLRSDNRRLMKERSAIIQENDTLSAFVEEKREVESLLSGFLSTEKSRRRHLEEELKGLKDKNESLEVLLKSEKERRMEVEKALDDSSLRVKKLLAARKNADRKLKNVQGIVDLRLKDIEVLRDNLTKIIESTKSDISKELDRIELTQIDIEPVVAPKKSNKTSKVEKKTKTAEMKPPAANQSRDGRILVVNKDLNFVVVNMGAQREIFKGMVFDIEASPGKKVGACKVIEVRKKISAADLIEVNGEIKKGYKVYERKS